MSDPNPSLTLSEFVRAAWHVVEPATPYVHGRHIAAICALLEALTFGEMRNGIVNIPPRHMKSLLVSVFWPCWVWTFRPASRWLFASYSESLAIRDSLKCRRLMQSPWYQERWGAAFNLTGDQNEKRRYENDRSGHRIVTTPGGLGTGEGGDFIVVDDPHKVQDAESTAALETACDWWDQVMSTRGNDPRTAVKVIIMQRLAEGDLAGHVLANAKAGGEAYELLNLPARSEPHDGGDDPRWRDWRTEEGELLWPERFGEKEVAGLETTLGADQAAGQLQQRPVRAGGAIYKIAWWAEHRNRYDATNEQIRRAAVGRWLSFDTAYKDTESSDFTGCSVFDVTPEYRAALREVWQERLEITDLTDRIVETAVRHNHDGKLRGIIIEDKGSGTSAYQSLKKSAPAWIADILTAFMPIGSKIYRAKQASLWCEKDCVLFPYPSDAVGDWLLDFEERLPKFPRGLHDDIEDSFSQGIIFLENLLAEGWQARIATPTADEAA